VYLLKVVSRVSIIGDTDQRINVPFDLII